MSRRGSFPISFRFAAWDPDDPEMVSRCIDGLTMALAEYNREWLCRHRDVPRLYSSGVRYLRQKRDVFLDVAAVIENGGSDCKNLAAWRIAELAVHHGIPATSRIVWYPVPKRFPFAFHVLVRRADGIVEDPSVALGMAV